MSKEQLASTLDQKISVRVMVDGTEVKAESTVGYCLKNPQSVHMDDLVIVMQLALVAVLDHLGET